jgi:hypothetical protein
MGGHGVGIGELGLSVIYSGNWDGIQGDGGDWLVLLFCSFFARVSLRAS